VIAVLLGLSERQLRARLDPQHATYDCEMAALIKRYTGRYIADRRHLRAIGVARLFDTMKMRAKNAILKRRDTSGRFCMTQLVADCPRCRSRKQSATTCRAP
jgi:hypothetical protein